MMGDFHKVNIFYGKVSTGGALRDLVPFLQFKKMWETPMEEC